MTAGDRGEAFVMARFSTYTVGCQFIVLPKGSSSVSQGRREQLHRHARPRQVEETAHQALARVQRRGVPSPGVDRRHRHAADSSRSISHFMADKSADKRAKLVDELLSRKEFAEMWVMKWAELLQIRTNQNVSTRRCSRTTPGCRTRSPATCRWTRWCRSSWLRRAARSRTRPRTTTRTKPTS